MKALYTGTGVFDVYGDSQLTTASTEDNTESVELF